MATRAGCVELRRSRCESPAWEMAPHGTSAGSTYCVVPTSLMIPAYEANDESEHVRHTERIVLRGHLPTISLDPREPG